MGRRLKRRVRTLRSQLLFWLMFYEANSHPRRAFGNQHIQSNPEHPQYSNKCFEPDCVIYIKKCKIQVLYRFFCFFLPISCFITWYLLSLWKKIYPGTAGFPQKKICFPGAGGILRIPGKLTGFFRRPTVKEILVKTPGTFYYIFSYEKCLIHILTIQ